MVRSLRHGVFAGMGLSIIFTAACVSPGCGGSNQDTVRGVPGAAKLLDEKDFTHWEGTGKDKKLVTIDMKERRRLLHEAQKKKLESQ